MEKRKVDEVTDGADRKSLVRLPEEAAPARLLALKPINIEPSVRAISDGPGTVA